MDTLSYQAKSTATRNMQSYFATHDTSYVAEDAIFLNMATGEEIRGRKAISDMLHHLYHEAFDAKADIINTIVNERQAILEANFSGKHIGEFAGFAASGKIVKVPFCVSYDLNDEGLIQNARIYMLVNLMMQQLSN